ncbi:MAG TPA: hypothetical protein VKV95_12130 [Terriglobia bacterium]|nr:hypothetical protein [Terriglobia bacterium]
MGTKRIEPLQAFSKDTEQDLIPRVEREHDPIKKAKYEIRLAYLKLILSDDACQKDDHESCQRLLNVYLELMRSSWKDLQSSGRNAVKQPLGFGELEMALRENVQNLEDLNRRMPFEDRGILDPVIQETNRIHDEVFAALFPSGGTHTREGKHVKSN